MEQASEEELKLLLPSARSRKFHESLKQKRRRIAAQQIEKSMSIAVQKYAANPALSSNAARNAWKLSTRFNIRLGKLRLMFCRNCKSLIIPPRGARVRLAHKNRRILTITCLKCGKTYRRPFQST